MWKESLEKIVLSLSVILFMSRSYGSEAEMVMCQIRQTVASRYLNTTIFIISVNF
jgi:hypothetical protein